MLTAEGHEEGHHFGLLFDHLWFDLWLFVGKKQFMTIRNQASWKLMSSVLKECVMRKWYSQDDKEKRKMILFT